MWLATEKGFYSVVINTQSKNKESEILIRARKKSDLENLNTGRKVHISKKKDYAYRIFVSRQTFLRILLDLGSELQYSNFKDHIKGIPNQKDKVSFYSEIWLTMNEYQGKFIKGLYNFRNFLQKVY